MVVSFHRIFLGGNFHPENVWGILLFLQFESTKAFYLSYMAASCPICNLVRIMEVLGLETFVRFLSMNIGDTHRHIIILYEFVHGSVYMYIMVQLYTWYIFAHHFRWASQLDNDAGHHINAFAVTTTIRSTRRWPYMCTWWEVPCLTSNA